MSVLEEGHEIDMAMAEAYRLFLEKGAPAIFSILQIRSGLVMAEMEPLKESRYEYLLWGAGLAVMGALILMVGSFGSSGSDDRALLKLGANK